MQIPYSTFPYSTFIRNLISFFLFLTIAQLALASEFPGRKVYPHVKYIELEDFRDKFKNVTVVDVRSKHEYEILRVKGAINVPVASRKFVKNMKSLRETDSQLMVLYCNGKTCMKSYQAVALCNKAKIKNVVAYDAGMMDWAKTYPKLSVLLDEPLKNQKYLISKKKFKKHLISPDKFGTLVSGRKGIVLDIRERFQREGLSIFAGAERRVTMDNKRRLNKYIKQAKKRKVPLLVFDASGKQVRWLQYYLEKMKVKKYYFMAGGIRAYIDGMTAQGR